MKERGTPFQTIFIKDLLRRFRLLFQQSHLVWNDSKTIAAVLKSISWNSSETDHFGTDKFKSDRWALLGSITYAFGIQLHQLSLEGANDLEDATESSSTPPCGPRQNDFSASYQINTCQSFSPRL